MRPLTLWGQPVLYETPVIEPRFWRVTYADLVSMWGEQGARRMLRAMERAYEQQVPAPIEARPGPCSELDEAFSHQ